MAKDTRQRPVRAARAGSDARPSARQAKVDLTAAETRGGGDTVRFEDPRAIRALAHPARMAIIDALATGAELTATDCAALTGLTPSATAYHLKFLERFGFAEPAPPRHDARERPWRVPERQITVELDSATPAGAAAVAAVAAAHFDSTRALGLAFVESSHAETDRWRDAPIMANTDLWLTADEVEAVGKELALVLDPYRKRRDEGARPEDSRRVRVMNVVLPHPRPQV